MNLDTVAWHHEHAIVIMQRNTMDKGDVPSPINGGARTRVIILNVFSCVGLSIKLHLSSEIYLVISSTTEARQ